MKKRGKSATNRSIEKKTRISSALDIPGDVMMDMPLIYCDGDRLVRCHNHKGVIEYTQQCLRFRTLRGEIRVDGKDLILQEYGSEILIVRGSILAVHFL